MKTTSPETLVPFETLWDANDVAAFLKLSRSWVYQRAEAGKLPCKRIGGLLRFDPAEIREWVRASSVTPATVLKLAR